MEKRVINGVIKKHITEQSYAGRQDITEAVIPDGVTHIEYEALCGCTNLKRITIPGSVRIMSNRAFADCSKLECVNLPPRVKAISSGMFDGCSSLTYVRLPESLEKIETRAFAGCSNLKYLHIPTRTYHIGNDVFEGTDIIPVLSVNSPLFGTLAKKGIKPITEAEFAALGLSEPAPESMNASSVATLLEGGLSTDVNPANGNADKSAEMLATVRSVLLEYMSEALTNEVIDKITVRAGA